MKINTWCGEENSSQRSTKNTVILKGHLSDVRLEMHAQFSTHDKNRHKKLIVKRQWHTDFLSHWESVPNPLVIGKIMPRILYISHTVNEKFIYANTFNQNIIWIRHCARHKRYMVVQWQTFKLAHLGTMPCKPCQPHTPSFKLVTHPHNTSNIYSPILLTLTDFLPWVKY